MNKIYFLKNLSKILRFSKKKTYFNNIFHLKLLSNAILYYYIAIRSYRLSTLSAIRAHFNRVQKSTSGHSGAVGDFHQTGRVQRTYTPLFGLGLSRLALLLVGLVLVAVMAMLLVSAFGRFLGLAMVVLEGGGGRETGGRERSDSRRDAGLTHRRVQIGFTHVSGVGPLTVANGSAQVNLIVFAFLL